MNPSIVPVYTKDVKKMPTVASNNIMIQLFVIENVTFVKRFRIRVRG